MASFCRDCSIRIFGKDFGDFKHNQIGRVQMVLCEGCSENGGWILVDWAGRKVERTSFEEWVRSVTL